MIGTCTKGGSEAGMDNVVTQHITKTPGVCGGRACIAGHRIRLIDIARCYNEGFSPEGIFDCYPTLSLALIHKCIAFCLENEPMVDRLLAEDAKAQR